MPTGGGCHGLTVTFGGTADAQPAETVAALGDVRAIDSYATLQAQMVDLLATMADGMEDWSNKRATQIMRKMVTTVHTVPYDMLAEFGHNCDPVLLAAVMILQVSRDDLPDYANAHDLMLTVLDELRRLDLDRPGAPKGLEEVKAILESIGRPRR